jgi:CRP-like cAMP-binding protein
VSNSTAKAKEKGATLDKLVNKMEVQLSMPEDIIICQGDDPTTFLLGQSEEKPSEHDIKMYVIARGLCEIRQKHKESLGGMGQQTDKNGNHVRTLIDSDHFGEISLIYDCKRTCTVVSQNYCTLATISKPDFMEVDRGGSMVRLMTTLKQYVCYYDDLQKLFIENSLNKVSYFCDLKMMCKNDIIFAMERVQFSKGELIATAGEKVEKLILVQDGIVELSVKLNDVVNTDTPNLFVIERLSRGAVINFQSFMMSDISDTDFKCMTKVSAFTLKYDALIKVSHKYPDL